MPKDRRSSLDRCRLSPYSWSNTVRRKPRSLAIPVGNEKEWEEARCPICMEHPHNAVLLLCSSLEKGCRPYIGRINECIKNNPARQFMDSKTRRCSMDTCNYTGNYLQLRKHARGKHARVRPTDVDPERELKWRNLEEYMELQDLVSMQSDFHEIDDEDIVEELADGQDMDGEDVDPGHEIDDEIDNPSMLFGSYEIDYEVIGLPLGGDSDISRPNVNNID
ncbi:hypothetical protein CTI12_AA621150 [Artemisia annua]|uniref:Uncharacterized protein n=1 Tax=Artemisia annua TaxID=35608 RepID=A0A2U1KBW6_ARTAN|nr:hypothetical protein CTI12_AA621150 [Artemisia annua]